jgi:hypothetical protein
METNASKMHSFSEKEIRSFVELGNILRKIHVRLLMEGYKIEDGTITKPDKNLMLKKSESIYNQVSKQV